MTPIKLKHAPEQLTTKVCDKTIEESASELYYEALKMDEESKISCHFHNSVKAKFEMTNDSVIYYLCSDCAVVQAYQQK